MATNRRAGTVSLRVNGTLIEVQGSVTWHDGKPTREAIVGFDGVHGYKETPVAPFIACEATFSPDLDYSALRDIDDATVTAELAGGQVLTLGSAWSAGAGEGNNDDGKVSLRFEGRTFDID